MSVKEPRHETVRRKLNDAESLKKQGLTLREIATRADVKIRWLGLIKSGKRDHPHYDMIDRVLLVLGEAGI